MRSNTSFFLDVLESFCVDILDGIALDWIWPVAWAYEALHGALDFAFLAGYELQAAMRARTRRESPKLSAHAQGG